jgi:hypothetical protein
MLYDGHPRCFQFTGVNTAAGVPYTFKCRYLVKIIDYGLCSEINEIYISLGYRQISPEYILKKFDNSYNISNLISKKIDNFGLFWLILDIFTNERLYNKYIKLPLKNHTNESYRSTLNFYLNLNNINKNTLSAVIKKELVDFTHKNIII